jgi:hypothetical protein
MKKFKLKHVYKSWKDLSDDEKAVARTKLRSFQKPTDCKYQYNQNGELVGVLDYSALADIFSI